MNSQNEPIPVTIIIHYGGHEDKPLHYDINEKFESCVNEFSSRVNMNPKSLIFLYEGRALSN